MKQNNRWRFILVILIVVWSLYEIYPPTSRDLVQEFSSRAENTDAAFTNILQRLAPLDAARPDREFANLSDAIGTNNIQNYFPFISAKNELYPATFILNQLQRDASGKIKLGLDLQGGTSFLVAMDTNALANAQNDNDTNHVAHAPDVSGALSQAVEVLRKRVDQFGVAEPVIQPAGGNEILIQLPGLSQSVKESAKEQIQKAAYLEFRMVKEDSDQIIHNGEPIPPGYELLKRVEPQVSGPPQITQVIVKKRAEPGLAGDIVVNAGWSRDNLGNPLINFELTKDGGLRFAEVTRDNIGQRLAIVLDGELYSAPTIQGAIETGNGQITGHFTDQEAAALANVLQNPLRAPLSIISSEDVDPTLGKDSIRSGVMASIYAVIFVSLFMLCYYWIAGIAANIALVTNIIILMGVMCSVGTTLTLPGIAGIVLTVGMAVDANVLIYERLREELAKGKSLRGAIAAGYARAFGTIFDSHVTTLISSVILIFMGTGPIKGFGVTLTIGVAASLFTSLVVTRLIFNFLLDRNILKSLPMMHIIKSAKVNFMKLATPLFILTWTFIVIALAYGIIGRGEKLFGIDFLGGDSTTFSYKQEVGVDQIRAALTATGEKDPQIQYQKDVSGGTKTLRVTTSSGSAQKVQQTLEEKFPPAKLIPLGTKTVGATVGRGHSTLGHYCLATVAVRHSGLRRVPLRIFLRRRRRRRGDPRRAADHRLLLHRQCHVGPRVQRHRRRRRADHHRFFHQRQDRHLRPHPRRSETRRARFVQGHHQPGTQPDLEPYNHHKRHGVPRDAFALHFRRRCDQRFRVHVPHWHHHRNVFLHLHRQRNRFVVAQRRTPEHRRLGGDDSKFHVGESLIFLRNRNS